MATDLAHRILNPTGTMKNSKSLHHPHNPSSRLFKSNLYLYFLIALLVSTGIFVEALNAQSLPEHTAKIADDIYSYGATGDAQSMFVITGEGVIAFESFNSEHAQGMLQAIMAVTDEPVKYLLHSHNHWDHASGGQVFKDVGAKSMAHIEAFEWMVANPGRDMAVPDESWGGTQKKITLGKITVDLHYMGMNHGLGMTIFHLPEQKVAYIADLAVPNRVLFSIVPDFNIKEWERSLEEILKLDFERAVYSHNNKENALAGGTKQDAIDNLQFIRDLREAMYAEFNKGTNPMMVPSVVQVPKYKDWAMYDQWLEMNAWRLLLDDFMGPFPWRPDHAYQIERDN